MELTDATRSALPAKSAAKLEALIAARDDAFAIVRAASEAAEREREHVDNTERSARRAVDQLPARAATPLGEKMWAEERQRYFEPVERAKAGLDRARARYEAASQRLQEHAYLARTLGWLEDARRDGLRLKATAVPIVKARDLRAEVDRIRAEITEISTAWEETEAAPRPSADAIAALNDDIDAIAARGRPAVDLRRRSGPPVRLMEREFLLNIRAGGAEANVAPGLIGDGGAAFLVWLLRNEIKERIAALVGDKDTPGALSDEAREARFSELSARRLELERLEEATIVAAEAEGMFIPRRSDCDPRAILEIVEA